jgi:integrase
VRLFPLSPNKANLTYAGRLRAEILRKIELGTFRYGDYFPDSPLASRKPGTVSDVPRGRQAWLAGELGKSTKNGYRKILEGHLYPAIGDDPMAASRTCACSSSSPTRPGRRRPGTTS